MKVLIKDLVFFKFLMYELSKRVDKMRVQLFIAYYTLVLYFRNKKFFFLFRCLNRILNIEIKNYNYR